MLYKAIYTTKVLQLPKKYISKGAPTKKGGRACQKVWRSQGDAEPTHKHENWKQI